MFSPLFFTFFSPFAPAFAPGSPLTWQSRNHSTLVWDSIAAELGQILLSFCQNALGSRDMLRVTRYELGSRNMLENAPPKHRQRRIIGDVPAESA